MREKRTGKHINLVSGDKFFGNADSVACGGVIVLNDQLDFLAIQAARFVNLFNCEFHTVFVRTQERGLRFITIQFADFNDVLGCCSG